MGALSCLSSSWILKAQSMPPGTSDFRPAFLAFMACIAFFLDMVFNAVLLAFRIAFLAFIAFLDMVFNAVFAFLAFIVLVDIVFIAVFSFIALADMVFVAV